MGENKPMRPDEIAKYFERLKAVSRNAYYDLGEVCEGVFRDMLASNVVISDVAAANAMATFRTKDSESARAYRRRAELAVSIGEWNSYVLYRTMKKLEDRGAL